MLQLESNENCLLHDVTSIDFSDSLLIVFDARGKSVLLFDMSGHFIRKIGKQGNGPGEFVQLTNMYYDPLGKLIEIFDNPQKKLFVYDLKGNLVETKRSVINFISFAKSSEGYYVYSPFVDHAESAGHNLFLLSKNLDHIKGRFLPTQNNFDRALYTGNFTYNDEELFFRHGLNDTIYKLLDGHIEPYLYVDFGRLKIPYQKVSALGNQQIYDEQVYFKEPPYLGQIQHVLANDKWLRFTFSEIKFGEKIMLSALYDRRRDTIQFYNSYATKMPGISNPYPKYYANEKTAYLIYPYEMNEEETGIFETFYGIKVTGNSNPLIAICYE